MEEQQVEEETEGIFTEQRCEHSPLGSSAKGGFKLISVSLMQFSSDQEVNLHCIYGSL